MTSSTANQIGSDTPESESMVPTRLRHSYHYLRLALDNGENWQQTVVNTLGNEVYITFDVDYFDPSIMPSTGTPEPGGLLWYPVLKLLRRVFAERNVVAADVVELAPIPGLTAPDFTVAKLVYKMIAYKHG